MNANQPRSEIERRTRDDAWKPASGLLIEPNGSVDDRAPPAQPMGEATGLLINRHGRPEGRQLR
jgi:hypothetical protein